MKTRFLKSITALLLICALAFSMTGCDGLDYREAIDLYNDGQFDAAAEMFSALGDYEDSAALLTQSHYWAAITLMEDDNFQEALPRFQKLGSYEDSAQRVTECKYQLAIADFDAGNYSYVEAQFRELGNYRQTQEYLRRITWQEFFDAVAAAGTESGGSFTLQKEQDNKVFSITADMAANQLILFVSSAKDMGYSFYDDLTLTLTRDSMLADFTAASTFSMAMNGNQIGSRQSASGKVDITACTPETVLTADTFEKTVTDNQGETSHSDDPADSVMDDTIADNFFALMTVIPELLLDAGVELTLKDIGFAAM